VGAQAGTEAPLRVVFDTNVLVSALLFRQGRLSWLRQSWQHGGVIPLADNQTVDELIRVLGYPKFALTKAQIEELLGLYLPFVEIVNTSGRSGNGLPKCRDASDQKFVALAQGGSADTLVTGDKALLELQGRTRFLIETPAAFMQRLGKPK
jgi:putative PIN family toxin of toxin-antitoxin system